MQYRPHNYADIKKAIKALRSKSCKSVHLSAGMILCDINKKQGLQILHDYLKNFDREVSSWVENGAQVEDAEVEVNGGYGAFIDTGVFLRPNGSVFVLISSEAGAGC